MKRWIGEVYGRLKVLERAEDYIVPSTGKRQPRYLCECLCCGEKVTVNASNLKNQQSCGCLRIADLTGKVFGRLTVLRKADGRSGNNSFLWECKCSCGNADAVVVPTDRLKSGETQSCGCLHIDTAAARTADMRAKTHIAGTNLGNIAKNAKSAYNTSGVRGVNWHKKTQMWQVRIHVQGKSISLGYYHDFADAVKARQEAEEKYFAPLLEEIEREAEE